MAILLIRHGETAGNRDRIVQVPETPLSDRGLAQAAQLGRRLAREPIAEIWTSHLMRAHQTAQAIERLTGAPLAVHPDLEERNFGDLRGTPYTELRVDPFVPEYDPPGGEGWIAFHERVDRTWEKIERYWLDRIASRGVNAHLVVVSHGLFLRSLLERRLLSAEELERYGAGSGKVEIANTALTIVAPVGGSATGARHRVELLACIVHLEADAATPAPPTGRL
jgi:probable phosphoglycerate mutase